MRQTGAHVHPFFLKWGTSSNCLEFGQALAQRTDIDYYAQEDLSENIFSIRL